MRKETEIAAHVIDWLADHRYEVYCEVSIGYASARADIVAMAGKISWIVEVKRSLSLSVIAQAFDWQRRGAANRVSVAIPWARNSSGRVVALRILREHGIGAIEVKDRGHRTKFRHSSGVKEIVPARLQRRLGAVPITKYLHPKQMNTAAGTNEGGYWTPFRNTCDLVRDYVRANPGVTAKHLMDNIDHHYMSSASARGSIIRWARAGLIEGVELREKSKPYAFYPKAAP